MIDLTRFFTLIALVGALASIAPVLAGANTTCEPVFSDLTQGTAVGNSQELAQKLKSVLGQESHEQMLSHFRIGAYNLENFRAGDWNKRKERRARAILREAPHVLVVQEAESLEALKQLCAAMGDTYAPLLIEGNKPRQHIGFLLRADLGLTHTLSTYREDKLFSRDFPILRLKDPQTGQILIEIGGVHLKSRVIRAGQPDPGIVRSQQSTRSVEILDSRRKGQPQLAVGDFQGSPTTEEWYDAFHHGGFQEAFSTVGLAAADRSTHVYFPGIGAQPIRAQLDAILFRDLAPQAILSSYVHRDVGKNGELLPPAQTYEELRERGSDHALIMAILNLR